MKRKEAISEHSKAFVLSTAMGWFANSWDEKDCVWRLVIAFVHIKLKVSVWPLGEEIGCRGWGGVGIWLYKSAIQEKGLVEDFNLEVNSIQMIVKPGWDH